MSSSAAPPTGICPFAHALGVPGKGVHAARFLGLARNDILLTVALAFILSIPPFVPSFSLRYFALAFLATLFIGECLHWAFGTDTALLKTLGIARNCT